jgi:choline dehydrogenase-like flavoprotein
MTDGIRFSMLIGCMTWLLAFIKPSHELPSSRCSDAQTIYDFVSSRVKIRTIVVVTNNFQIIIGGGTAGLAVASRLGQSLTEACILVVEAGPDGRSEPGIYIPGRKGSTFGTKYDWNLTTISQSSLNGRTVSMTRGKVLGGCSALNLMTWDRGAKADFDAWEHLGNPGWNWKSMYAAMLKVETFTPSPEYGTEGAGHSGPIDTLINRILPAHQVPFIPTMEKLGLKPNLNSLNGNPMGVMRQPGNIKNEDYTRSYSVEYLDLAGPNVILRLSTRVAKINFTGKTASGITLEDGTVIGAKKEIILSAGSLQSPGLLELSGIGNKDVLKAAGVSKTIYNLPGVGENLQDHLRIQNSYQLKAEFVGFDRLRYNSTFAAEQLALWNANEPSQYDYTGSGFVYMSWAQVSPATCASLISAASTAADPSSPIDRKKLSYLTNPKLASQMPQLELIFSDGYTGAKGYPAVGTPLYGNQFFTLIGGIQHPLARGSVHINSSSISAPPLIDPKYLSNAYDLAAAIATIKYLRKVASTAPLSSVYTAEYDPGIEIMTDAQWEQYARNTTLSIYHPIGTCPMLPEKDGGVVDPSLKVYGVKGLRVVDGSVIPILPSAHVQTVVYGVAERAAQIIAQEWKGQR